MDVKITPHVLGGGIRAITSKSAAHRALICAAISRWQGQGETEVRFDDTSEDIEATAKCLEAMREKNSPVVNCGESGSTFRFLLPLALLLCENAEFAGKGRLPERPISDLLNALRANGAEFSAEKIPFRVSGKLKSGEYRLPGNISSQFVSGLLFALPLLDGDSVITLTSRLESIAYVDMTVNMLKKFGVEIIHEADNYTVKGNQKYRSPEVINVESDWSNAAFFLAAGALGESRNGVTMTGLDMNSAQGDKEIVELLKKFGAGVKVCEKSVKVLPGELKGIEIDVSEIPDLLPILAVTGAFAKGKTLLYNAARLRMKESDRLSSVCEMLGNLGAKVEEKPDSLVITGSPGKLNGGTVNGKGDHRIVMSAAICGCFCENEVMIKGAEAVNKSYPRFFEDYAKLGGKYVIGFR
ncbi:MAG: 3-phosphoshikimate 1-carboxyvinyltransferase [Oscillospiraceae bacterium]|nr:3-phosphoshikimate 1-carboxyvinyltransferase [Oscillospiraceae bacterium]